MKLFLSKMRCVCARMCTCALCIQMERLYLFWPSPYAHSGPYVRRRKLRILFQLHLCCVFKENFRSNIVSILIFSPVLRNNACVLPSQREKSFPEGLMYCVNQIVLKGRGGAFLCSLHPKDSS